MPKGLRERIADEIFDSTNDRLDYAECQDLADLALAEIIKALPPTKPEIPFWSDCTSTGNADDAYDHGLERGEVFGFNACLSQIRKELLPSNSQEV